MDPALPDVRLSRYRLERPLGAGGMGAVYLARDLSLDRQVAIKFISNERASDAIARRRLVREARAAAALDHPNICTVFEVIDEAGSPAAIVMQYVEGQTLASKLSSGRLDIRSALSIITDVAAALAHAHGRNIIHRDLKPQNIIVTPDGRAKLLDFGIARLTEPAGPSDDVTTASRLTGTGDTPGTPAYMSPEQVDGRALDRRSDLFALGAVLFECLTGERAFKGRNAMEIASRIISYDPPPPSSLRLELTEGHDEICRRLLAKDPRDRFNSADELLGALQLLSTGTLQRLGAQRAEGRRWNWKWVAGIAAVVVLFAAFAAWRWRAAPSMPDDPQAADWYRRGTEAIRDGSPHSARRALAEVIKVEPDYIPAYIRLAEAETELDETEGAQETLLRAGGIGGGEARLPFEDRTRARAVRALMLRERDEALDAYRQIAERRPGAPEVWIDLGRAQDAFALIDEARGSYERALQIDDDYAAAHLRRATILGFQGHRDEALASFAEAQRIYHAAANVEGEVETFIRRGTFFNGVGDLPDAREQLERALALAGTLDSTAHRIRAELTLSTVTASEGKWAEAEKMAADAVETALREHLETIAADGLVDLATVLVQRGRTDEAESHLARAIELAEERRAYRIVARAKYQRAAILATSDREEEAIAALQWPLEYFQTRHYRRYEMLAANIMSRAYEGLGQYVEARKLADVALAGATEIKDEAGVGEALENLGGQSNALGALPEALQYRLRGLEIHRRQQDASRVGYDLTNTADLLIRLGRADEGVKLLDEIDAGVARKIDAYFGRARRAAALRALAAAISRSPDAEEIASRLTLPDGGKPDLSWQLTNVLIQYAQALGGSTRQTNPSTSPLLGSVSSQVGRELRYWDLLVRLIRNDSRALSGAEETLGSKDATLSYEFEWRIAAIGAAATRRQNLPDREHPLRARAEAALARLRSEWKSDVTTYDARSDLVELRRKAGLN